MGKFVVKKRVTLEFLGEGWQEAYAEFTPFTFNDNDKILKLRRVALDSSTMSTEEASKASDEIMNLLKDGFVGGMGFDGEKLVPITKENLGDLPMEVTVHFLKTLQGGALLPPKD